MHTNKMDKASKPAPTVAEKDPTRAKVPGRAPLIVDYSKHKAKAANRKLLRSKSLHNGKKPISKPIHRPQSSLRNSSAHNLGMAISAVEMLLQEANLTQESENSSFLDESSYTETETSHLNEDHWHHHHHHQDTIPHDGDDDDDSESTSDYSFFWDGGHEEESLKQEGGTHELKFAGFPTKQDRERSEPPARDDFKVNFQMRRRGSNDSLTKPGCPLDSHSSHEKLAASLEGMVRAADMEGPGPSITAQPMSRASAAALQQIKERRLSSQRLLSHRKRLSCPELMTQSRKPCSNLSSDQALNDMSARREAQLLRRTKSLESEHETIRRGVATIQLASRQDSVKTLLRQMSMKPFRNIAPGTVQPPRNLSKSDHVAREGNSGKVKIASPRIHRIIRSNSFNRLGNLNVSMHKDCAKSPLIRMLLRESSGRNLNPKATTTRRANRRRRGALSRSSSTADIVATNRSLRTGTSSLESLKAQSSRNLGQDLLPTPLKRSSSSGCLKGLSCHHRQTLSAKGYSDADAAALTALSRIKKTMGST